jgi:hypothetical protein
MGIINAMKGNTIEEEGVGGVIGCGIAARGLMTGCGTKNASGKGRNQGSLGQNGRRGAFFFSGCSNGRIMDGWVTPVRCDVARGEVVFARTSSLFVLSILINKIQNSAYLVRSWRRIGEPSRDRMISVCWRIRRRHNSQSPGSASQYRSHRLRSPTLINSRKPSSCVLLCFLSVISARSNNCMTLLVSAKQMVEPMNSPMAMPTMRLGITCHCGSYFVPFLKLGSSFSSSFSSRTWC